MFSSAAVAVVFGDSSNILLTALPSYWGNSARCRYLSMVAIATNKFLNLEPESHFFHQLASSYRSERWISEKLNGTAAAISLPSVEIFVLTTSF